MYFADQRNQARVQARSNVSAKEKGFRKKSIDFTPPITIVSALRFEIDSHEPRLLSITNESS
jgi:hypothetical protein